MPIEPVPEQQAMVVNFVILGYERTVNGKEAHP